MRLLSVFCLMCAVSACGAPSADRNEPEHPWQGKRVTEPGVSISGDVRVGVVRVF